MRKSKYIKGIILVYVVISLCIITSLSLSLSKVKTNNEIISMGSYVCVKNEQISVNINTIKEEVEFIDQNIRSNYITVYEKIDENVIKAIIPDQYIVIITCYENKIDMIVIDSNKNVSINEYEKQSDYLVSFEWN